MEVPRTPGQRSRAALNLSRTRQGPSPLGAEVWGARRGPRSPLTAPGHESVPRPCSEHVSTHFCTPSRHHAQRTLAAANKAARPFAESLHSPVLSKARRMSAMMTSPEPKEESTRERFAASESGPVPEGGCPASECSAGRKSRGGARVGASEAGGERLGSGERAPAPVGGAGTALRRCAKSASR